MSELCASFSFLLSVCSYPGRVVGSTLKAQRENPEMTVRHTDLDLKRMKHRLEQLTQVQSADTFPLSLNWVLSIQPTSIVLAL